MYERVLNYNVRHYRNNITNETISPYSSFTKIVSIIKGYTERNKPK